MEAEAGSEMPEVPAAGAGAAQAEASALIDEAVGQDDAAVPAEAADAEGGCGPVDAAPDHQTSDGPAPMAEAGGAGTARPREAAGRAILESDARADEEAVERLLRHADSEFAGEDVRRRHDTVSHLRAAVAATRAEAAGPEAPVDADGDAEAPAMATPLPRRPQARGEARSERPRVRLAEKAGDTADAAGTDIIPAPAPERRGQVAPVRPVRPVAIEAGDSQRPAPLVLGAAQRIDRTDRPDTAPAQDEAFMRFVTRVGATDLADVLEAAAVYTVHVDGIAEFSRPQLLRRAAEAGLVDRADREAGLRVFGRLLREGRILRGRRGLFEVAPDSRFTAELRHPERRAAAER
jgi:hypothetical protein